jgi:hypothetical protein
MHFQYPLETIARKRKAQSQLEFAREAKSVLVDSDEALFEPHPHGLAIFAANEEALAQPTRLLRDLWGDFVEVQRPKVRYMPGEPPHQPIMHVRVATRREFAVRVLAELRARRARILEECTRDRAFIVRAEAPLAAVLGLPAKLDALTGGDAASVIRLLGYSPVSPDPAAA